MYENPQRSVAPLPPSAEGHESKQCSDLSLVLGIGGLMYHLPTVSLF